MISPTATKTQTTERGEASLIAMARAGDELAIDQLVSRYWREAFRVALRILRSHEDAEELAQDALWTAITHLSSFREDASFRTWLHRIVVNHSLMELRRRHSRVLNSPSSLSVDALPRWIQGPRTPEELLLEAECRTVIEEGLSRLPTCYSVALQLATCEDRSTNEIADRMGISKSAVKTRLHRGRAHLRREILRRSCAGSDLKLESKERVHPYCREAEAIPAA